jgi:hypothetical protein
LAWLWLKILLNFIPIATGSTTPNHISTTWQLQTAVDSQ